MPNQTATELLKTTTKVQVRSKYLSILPKRRLQRVKSRQAELDALLLVAKTVLACCWSSERLTHSAQGRSAELPPERLSSLWKTLVGSLEGCLAAKRLAVTLRIMGTSSENRDLACTVRLGHLEVLLMRLLCLLSLKSRPARATTSAVVATPLARSMHFRGRLIYETSAK